MYHYLRDVINVPAVRLGVGDSAFSPNARLLRKARPIAP